MNAVARLDPDWVWSNLRQSDEVDQDIISFCARLPHLVELAFTLADNGHTHVGHVARLTEYTVVDLANGRWADAEALGRLLRRAGLDFDMRLDGWSPPKGDLIDAVMD